MKKLILLILFLYSNLSFSQRTYEFDLVIKYNYVFYDNPTKNNYLIYLINSEDNSYFARVFEKDGNNYAIEFLDSNNLLAKTNITKSDFEKGNIIIDCIDIKPFSNPYKFQTKNYAFSSIKDTVINEKPNKFYTLESVNKKRTIKKKLGKYLYIIDSKVNCKPIFTFSTAYEEWKLNNDIPKGLLTELHFYNNEGKIISSEKMNNYDFKNKKIIIPNCE